MILFVACVWSVWSSQTWHAPLAFAVIATVFAFIVFQPPTPVTLPASAWVAAALETVAKYLAVAYAGWGIGLGIRRLTRRKDA